MFVSLTLSFFRVSLLVILAFLLLSVAEADDDKALRNEMRRCTSLPSDNARLACFEQLANDVLQTSESPVETIELESSDTTILALVSEPADGQAGDVKPLTDAVGKENVRRDDSIVNPEYAATVTRCERNPRGRYYFYFANGQVWKQTNSRRLHFRDCNFEVTVSRDIFGYKMSIAGQRKRIRISRIK